MATKPKSKKDNQSNPFYKKWWFWTIVVVVLAVGIGASSNKGEPQKVGEASNSTPQNTTQSTQPEKTTFKVGDIISLDNVEVVVTGVERNYVADNQYVKPSDGKEFVKVNLQIQNKSSDAISYNTLEWKIEDGNGSLEDYMSAMMAAASDSLNSGEIVAGGKKIGSIVFETPLGDALKLHYKPLWKNKEIVVELQ